MWTQDDLRELRRWRIEPSPLHPLPRFQVEPSEIEGEYSVIDRCRKYRAAFVFPATWSDPRAEAQATADELNAKHEKESEQEP